MYILIFLFQVVGANFDKKVIQEDKPVLLYFYANWCKIC
jgi:thioredoxin-like negative regulator of GroEL